jgi:hypothetical protein
MLNLAQKTDDQNVWLGFGHVIEKLPDHYHVDTETGVLKAEKADGCLLSPEPGDRVLLAIGQDGEAYILNVLKRSAKDSPASICLGNSATIQVPGELNVLAEKTEFASTKEISLKTGRFNLSCLKGRTRFGEFLFSGGKVSGHVESIKTAARHLETVADRVMERVKRHYRRVEELEDSRIGRVTMWVNDLFSIKSKSTAIKSKDRVEVNADRILLG